MLGTHVSYDLFASSITLCDSFGNYTLYQIIISVRSLSFSLCFFLSLLLDTLNNFVTFFVPPLRDTRNFTNKTLLCHCHSPFPFSLCCLLLPLFPLFLPLPFLYPFALWSIAVSSRSLPQTKQTFWQRFHFHINFFVCLLQRKQQRQSSTKAAKNGYYCYALLPKISPGLGK